VSSIFLAFEERVYRGGLENFVDAHQRHGGRYAATAYQPPKHTGVGPKKNQSHCSFSRKLNPVIHKTDSSILRTSILRISEKCDYPTFFLKDLDRTSIFQAIVECHAKTIISLMNRREPTEKAFTSVTWQRETEHRQIPSLNRWRTNLSMKTRYLEHQMRAAMYPFEGGMMPC